MTNRSESPALIATVRCIACDEEAPSTRRFCGKCGQLLWEPCLECGENNSVQEKFCGKCGADTEACVLAVQRELAESISVADQLAAEGRFVDALDELSGVVVADHSQLESLATEVRNRVDSYPKQREEAIELVKRANSGVRELLEQRRLFEAHDQLTAIPPAFRDHEIRELLANVESAVGEVKQLRALIRERVQQRDYDGLLPHVQRLVELHPSEPQVKKLHEQLAARQENADEQLAFKCAKAAIEALKRCDYGRASTALARMPPGSEDAPKLAKSIARVRESVWLNERMKSEPYATPALRAVAQRLTQLQPHDERHTKRVCQLDQRLKKAAREGANLPASWALSAGVSELGLPVDLLPAPVALARARTPEGVSAPGLMTAFGLAVQGLGRGKVSINLSPKPATSSWFGKIATLGKKSQPTAAWGIDLGTERLKAVRVVADDNATGFSVDQVVVIAINQNTSGDPGQATAAAVKQFCQSHDVGTDPVVVSIPGAQTLGRFFVIPAPKPEKFFEAVTYEVGARVPQAIDELVFDYHWSEVPSKSKEDTPQRRVTLVAANRRHVEKRCAPFYDAGLSNLVVQSDSIALANAMHGEAANAHTSAEAAASGGARSEEPISVQESCIAVIEVGGQTSSFVATSPSHLWFRSLYQGTATLDIAIAKGLKIKRHDAEQLRADLSKAPVLHQLHEIMTPAFGEFADELRKTIKRCQSEIGVKLSKVLLTGAGAEQLGLLYYLRAGR